GGSVMDHPGLAGLRRAVIAGTLTRRQVLRRGVGLGLGAPAIAALLAACGSSSSSSSSSSSASSASSSSSSSAAGSAGSPAATASATSGSSPAASPAASTGSSTASTSTTSGPATTRGQGGQLKLLWWQTATIMNGHLAAGTTDSDAARVVQEPLGDFDSNGNVIPILADHAPSMENGEVDPKGMSVTWKLKSGVVWSDGQPFTSADVKFTYDYVSNPATAAVTIASYAAVASVDAPDDLTVVVHFKKPTPNWWTAFCGSQGYIVPQHILANYVGSAAAHAPFNLKPIGTGAFVVTDFVPGDHADYAANPKYRDATKPFFATVNLKGGGDATSAARAVLQLGEVDYAWNLQVSANVLKSLETSGGPGKLLIYPGTSVEAIMVNMTDPNKVVDGQQSHLGTPHPFQADPAVRQAYSLLVDRATMANSLYGPAGQTTANVLVSPAKYNSKTTSWKYDVAQAEQLLENAGYTKGSDGIRAKNGVKLQVVYQTTVNTLRQQEQEIVKNSFQQAGINVTLKSIDSGVFFSSGAGNPDTYEHFYADLEMFTNGPTDPFPIAFMAGWYGATSNIAQRENSWSGLNIERWQNSQYDALYEQALTEMDPAKQPALFIGMNDLVINNWVRIPEVWRNGVSGASRKLQNINLQTWASSELWNLANWTKTT
ncbi:MAG TPA: peptide ABC transporter substrate-binding protein, partial [Thermomicrobiaceae bacterium]|nr:peptide ABC transporter substrate-binding protein [Thermomicrobiaceae bacterium]